MTEYYYSTQAFLAWCLNHYFYNGLHFAYVGAPFYPYRLGNPRTSNSMRVYEEYYEAWKDEDAFSEFIDGKRIGLRKGFNNAKPENHSLLKDICDNIDIIFFYPIVYRVDLQWIRKNNPFNDPEKPGLHKSNSGALRPNLCEKPSNEYVISKLRQKEASNISTGDFDILMLDLEVEIELQDKSIDQMKKFLAPGETIPPRDSAKLEIYKSLKRLYEERATLTEDQVLIILKKYSGIF